MIPIPFQVMEATAMRSFMMFALVVGTMTFCASIWAGDPALPGHHPLTQSQAGSVLISEGRCNACHRRSNHSLPEKTAPNLSHVGSRLSHEYLKKYLASPLETHPGTTMPDLLASHSESERRTIAEELTHFLVGQSTPVQDPEPLGPIDRQQGKTLFHSIGCVSCHGPIEPPTGSPPILRPNQPVDEEDDEDPVRAAKKLIQPNVVSLEHVKTKYSIRSLRDFLFQPLHVRSSGRMPDMKLTPSESLHIAAYLIGDTPQNPSTFVPDPAKAALGKKHFQQLNCAACHPHSGLTAAPLQKSLKEANLQQGCLANENSSTNTKRSPRFHFDDAQRKAIVAAIRDDSASDTEKIAIAKSLTAFRCINCHVREDYGGVHDQHQPYFQGSELNLGEDGRIPPPLTLVGAKLQPNWMKKVLFDGESVRHYMATRMPQYGSNNLQHLPGLFRQQDRLEGPEMKIPNPESRTEEERQREKTMRAAGRELLGDKGANCVACHQFNGKAANVNQGIDLLTSFERLQPEYFYRYLRNPGSFRPRTVMPTAWPDGKATFKTILEGDTDRQIEAIWYYLSLGTSAADPPGVRPVNTKLEVTALAALHRGRSRVAGFRGIAVGLPERISYAFNAETGTLSAIWQGDFVRVNWSGQDLAISILLPNPSCSHKMYRLLHSKMNVHLGP